MSRTVRNRLSRKSAERLEQIYNTRNSYVDVADEDAAYSRTYPNQYYNKSETGLGVDHFVDPRGKAGRKARSYWTRDHRRGFNRKPSEGFIDKFNASRRMDAKTQIHRWISSGGEVEVAIDTRLRYDPFRDWS